MNEKITQKIKQVQRAPAKIKKRWLYAVTTISMILVISSWLTYLNFSLPNNQKEATDKNASKENSAIETLKKGFGVISNDFKEKIATAKEQLNLGVSSLKSELGKNNEFSFETQKQPETQTLTPQNITETTSTESNQR